MPKKTRQDEAEQINRVAKLMRSDLHRKLRAQGLSEKEIEELEEAFG